MKSRSPYPRWILAVLLWLFTTPTAAQERSDPDTTVAFLMGAFSLAPPTGSPPFLSPNPLLSTPPQYNEGSLTLALGEVLLSNFVPWAFNEYAARYKDITRISPTRWKENVSAGFLWDDNHFHVNLLMHPYAGSLSYNAGRTNGYSFEQSFLFALLGSALWECCGESHRPSPGDLLSTTMGGTALGEMLYRWTSQLLNRANQPSRNGWWEVPVAVLNPTRTVTRWTLGRFSAPNPMYEEPTSWALFTETGWISGPGKVFHETGYTYGDVIAVTRRSRPFSHFETAVELAYGDSAQIVGRVQARGSLWSRRSVGQGLCLMTGGGGLNNCIVKFLNIIPFLGFDYINNPAYEFGGQSVGLAAFFTVGQYPGGTHGVLTVDGHGLFGGVESEWAYLAQRLHDVRSERDREYDFTLGSGWGVAAIGSHQCLRVSGFYRRNRHWVVNGSSVAGPANHLTTLLGATARCRLFGRFGLGVEYRRYGRNSRFETGNLPVDFDFASLPPDRVRMTHDRFGIFFTLDAARPLGLFVF